MICLSDTQYFYDPDEVSRIVGPYPYLSSWISKYRREEGLSISCSNNFPYARKSYREIYRVLGDNHLQKLLPAFETCLANEFEPTGLFKPAASDFYSTLSTVFAARWFLERGYVVSNCDMGRGRGRIFDFIACNSHDNFLVEVYSPRSWEGFHDFYEELRLALKHLDCPYNFSYRVNINLAEPDYERGILHFNPWEFSQAMKTPERRLAVIRKIRDSVLDKLRTDTSPFAFETDVAAKRTTTRISIKLDDINQNLARLPDRLFDGGYYSLTGYAPEKMFEQNLRRKVVGKKLERRQLPYEKPKDGVRVLLVDVTRLTFLTDETQCTYYRKSFLDSIERHLLDRIRPERRVDLVMFAKMSLDPEIIFCCACGPDGESDMAAFVGDGRKLQVLRRSSEFVVAAQGV
jgi:hypothetical protein